MFETHRVEIEWAGRPLKLETGNVDGFAPAWRLYERGGFTRCGAFLDYPDSGYSAFFEKTLTSERPNA